MDIVKKYPDDVAVVIKYLPFKGQTSMDSAQLTMTLWQEDPKAFEALHHKFMQNRACYQMQISKMLSKPLATIS